MKKLISLCLSALLVPIFPTMTTEIDAVDSVSNPRVVGYLPDWSYNAYKTIDFGNLTHLNIAFCNPNENGDISCWIPDSEFARIVEKAHENDVKVMAALGGAGGCDGYIDLIDTQQEMADLNAKIMTFCEKYSLDGVDLDIELGSGNAVWSYYGDWVDSLRVLCDERDYELSTATAQWVAWDVSDATFAKFDFVNVMAYDSDESRTSHADMDFAVKSLNFFHNRKNIPNEKLVLGVPFYGRGYAADGSLDWNSYMAYKDIIAKSTDNYNTDVYDGIAYNGAATIAEKCRLAKDYGGIMIWELSQDTSDEYSLLKVIGDTLRPQTLAGDVNRDGEVNIADAVMLQKWLLGSGTLTDWKAGDLCEDGVIDVFDMVMMRKKLIENHVVQERKSIVPGLKNGMTKQEVFAVIGENYDASEQSLDDETEYYYHIDADKLFGTGLKGVMFVEISNKTDRLVNYGYHLGRKGNLNDLTFPYSEAELKAAYEKILPVMINWYGEETKGHLVGVVDGIRDEYTWEVDDGQIWLVYGINLWASIEPESYEKGFNEIILSCANGT